MELNDKRTMRLFLAIIALHYTAANFAHPVTPTLIKTLGINDYMFGVAFAAMSFTSFLFSPFWGKISKYYPIGKSLFVCSLGYALGQFFFLIAKNESMIIAARAFSGLFVGGMSVLSLTYVVKNASPEQQGRYLAIMSTFVAAFGAFGFLVGGLLGEISIAAAFLAQIALIALAGLFFFLLGRKQTPVSLEAHPKFEALIKEANPLSSFTAIRPYLSSSLVVLFLASMFAYVGLNAYDQSFNYYIKDQFNFSPVYNGALKALVGVISLAANFTICIRIFKKTRVRLPNMLILLGCGIVSVAMVLMPTLITFLLVNIVLFALDAMFQPLLQGLVSRRTSQENSGVVMGFFSAVRFLGMIMGALVAGFTYTIAPKIPFWVSAAAFFVAAVFALLYWKADTQAKPNADA